VVTATREKAVVATLKELALVPTIKAVQTQTLVEKQALMPTIQVLQTLTPVENLVLVPTIQVVQSQTLVQKLVLVPTMQVVQTQTLVVRIAMPVAQTRKLVAQTQIQVAVTPAQRLVVETLTPRLELELVMVEKLAPKLADRMPSQEPNPLGAKIRLRVPARAQTTTHNLQSSQTKVQVTMELQHRLEVKRKVQPLRLRAVRHRAVTIPQAQGASRVELVAAPPSESCFRPCSSLSPAAEQQRACSNNARQSL
jgi:hypothetical protein